MTWNRVCNKSITTGNTSGSVTVHPSVAHRLTPFLCWVRVAQSFVFYVVFRVTQSFVFYVGFVLLNLLFSMLCFVYHSIFSFSHFIICLSSIDYGYWLPLWYFQTFIFHCKISLQAVQYCFSRSKRSSIVLVALSGPVLF